MSPPDIWTGPACPDYRLTVGADVDGHTEAAERFWQQAHTLWSQAQAANCAARRRVQHAGVTRFCPVKPAALGRGLVRAPLRAVRRPEPSTSATL